MYIYIYVGDCGETGCSAKKKNCRSPMDGPGEATAVRESGQHSISSVRVHGGQKAKCDADEPSRLRSNSWKCH